MFIIAGLGNPTSQYENTRHNVGFAAMDVISKELGIKIDMAKHKALTGTGYIEGEKVLLMKPQTYMNLSGEAIKDALSFYKLDPKDSLLVIYDDISLDVGKLRLRSKGSAGGHNGIKSIIAHAGTEEFMRIKIGVGNKPAGYDLCDYVLGHFSKDDKPVMEEAYTKAYKASILAVTGCFDKAMNLYNQK
jgi:peptidyl-tRNA hydrolase, PTH1 family